MSTAEPDYKQLVKAALVQINQLQRQLADKDSVKAEPIAIVGYGCRLPGGIATEADYWRRMRQDTTDFSFEAQQRFNLNPVFDPLQRRPGKTYTRALSLLDGYENFDAAFFAISDDEALRLDPQQRLLLETSWEAFERAGIVPDHLAGHTGSYIGLSTQEYAQVTSSQRLPEQVSAYDGPGSSLAVAAGRLNYFYGFTGPALAIDTACSSVLVCIHEAMQALRRGQVDTALAGGVSLLINPLMMLVFAQAGVLSAAGRQRCFDAEADGYVRAEACTLLVLKRLRDARAEGLPVLAVLKGGAVNHGGHSQGITTPNQAGQKAVMEAALRDAGINARDVDLVEAHATGTLLGDFIELSALQDVYGGERSQPLWITSVKSRLGHAETGAAGPSLLSALWQLRAQQIAAQHDFQTPNHLFEWESLPFQVPTRPTPWQGNGIAAVSGFGYNGTNAHLILTAAPPAETLRDMPLAGLKLSARSPQALQQLARNWLPVLASITAEHLPAMLAMANGGRADFEWRVWLPATTCTELAAACARLADGENLPAKPVRSGRPVALPELPLDSQSQNQLINAWLNGASLPWRSLYSQLAVAELPTYPFERKRYWPDLSADVLQHTQLRRISHTDLFLGQCFAEPDGTRFHGYFSLDHLSLNRPYCRFGAVGIPPLWPVVAAWSNSARTGRSLSSLLWGEWPTLSQDEYCPLHSQIQDAALHLQWQRGTEPSHWQTAFRARYSEPAAVLHQHHNQASAHSVVTLEGSVTPAPLGAWILEQESRHAEKWLAILTFLQQALDVHQTQEAAGTWLFPASADQFWLDDTRLLQCLQAQMPLQSILVPLETAGTGMQCHWSLQLDAETPLLSVDNLVLLRVDAARMAGHRAMSDAPLRRMPNIDLTTYHAELNALSEAPLDTICQQLESLLISTLATATANEVSGEHSLFSLGIDSLWAMEFRARLQQELQLELPLAFLLQGPSLAQLAGFLAQQVQARSRRQAPRDTDATATPTTNDDEFELTL